MEEEKRPPENRPTVKRPPAPILSVVGNSGSGKTVFLEKLIPDLKNRGLRIGVIKNDSHDFDIDVPGKDSWRLAQAGADLTMIASPRKVALIEKWEEKESLEQLARRMNHVDLVLTEGFRLGNAPKIEVRRAACGHEPIFGAAQLFAVITDVPPDESSQKDAVPRLPLDDVKPLAELIMEYVKTYRQG